MFAQIRAIVQKAIKAGKRTFANTLARGRIQLFSFLIYSMCLFWSTYVLIKTIFRFIRNPMGFFYVKARPNKPAVLRREFQHGFVQTQNQIRIHYVEAGDPHRPLLLFLHGFPEFWYSWRHQLREFKNDYHVVAIDMRGYGDSSKPEAISDYRMEYLLDDVTQVVEQLGDGKCILAAHDWGGAIAWRFTLEHPVMVEKLIILNCPHPKALFDRLHSLFHFDQWLQSWYMAFYQCPFLPELVLQAEDMKTLVNFLIKPPSGCTDPNALTEEDIEAWKYTFQQPGALTAPINYFRESFALGPAAQNVGGRQNPAAGIVKPPTLIIWGTNDSFLVTAMAFTSLQFCHNGMLRLIHGASHYVQQDRPEECNQFIRDFLKV